jgi:hypothetical protein
MRSGEKYNPETNTWTSIPNMRRQRENFSMVVINDTIFVIGGFDGMSCTSNVEYFDDRKNKWFVCLFVCLLVHDIITD